MDLPTGTTVPYYLHAPVTGFYFLAAALFALVKMQKAKPISTNLERIIVALSTAILIGFLAEVLYYLSRSLAESSYVVPHHATIRCLGAILVWIPLCLGLATGNSIVWHPYYGAFVVQSIFEVVTYLLRSLSLPSYDRYSNVPLIIGAARALTSLLLVLLSFVMSFQKNIKKGTDDEERPILSAQQDGYGAIEPATTESDEGTSVYDNNVKEQQKNRLKENGGWFGYLGSFLIFLPYLWPKDDWKVMLSLLERLLNLILVRVLNLFEPRQLGIITNKVTEGSQMPWGDIRLWLLFSWLNSDSGLGILDDFAATVISTSALERIKILAHTHLMRLSVDFHTGKDSGEVLKAIEQASSLNKLLDLILFDIAPILVDLVVAMYYVTHLFDAYMTIIILSIGMAYVWLGFIFTTITQPRRRETSEKERVESATVNETVHNWQTVAYFNREIYEAKRYLEKIRATNTARYAYKIRSKGGNATQDLLVTLGFTATCVFALSQIITGNKPVGNFITFLMYWNTIIRPLQVMSSSYQYAATSLIDAERLLQLLNTKPTVVDCEDAQDLVIETGKVEFKDVGFAYNLRKPVTEKLSFTVKGGQTVALVGETGGGKSTILKLLFRFYDVTMGSVLIDNQDLRDVTLSSLRESLGIVPQDSALFNASIRENVRYAKRNATNAEIEEACRAASIHNDIVSFPDGYNTKVGERGVRLSGGQLQRISIARVLLKNPKIVLLDEATSAVDSITEEHIQKAIKRLSKGRTTFVIAHRLSTVMEADQILVIDQGKVSERGTHGELLSMKGKYYELWTKQSVATI